MLLSGIIAAVGGVTLSLYLSLSLAVCVVLARPFLGLIALTALLPIEYVLMAGESVTGMRALGMLVAAAWFAGKVLRRESFAPLLSQAFPWVALSFLALALLSSLWADVPARTYAGFVQLVRLFAFSVIILDLVTSEHRILWLLRALVLGALVAGVLTLHQYILGGVQRAGADVMGVNRGAMILTISQPFAFFMVLREQRWTWRLCGASLIPIGIAAVSVTFSRMNYLLLPIVLIAMVLPAIRTRKGRRWLVILIGSIAAAAITLVPWEQVRRRTSTIGPYLSASIVTQAAGGETMSSRGYHLRVALAMFQRHPVMGVGYNQYGYHFVRTYQYHVPGRDVEYGSWRSPHSSHLGIAADLGILGILLWVALLLVPAWNLLRARRVAINARDSRRSLLVFAALLSFAVLALPYGLYGPTQQYKIFWFTIGLAIAMPRVFETQRSGEYEGAPLPSAGTCGMRTSARTQQG